MAGKSGPPNWFSHANGVDRPVVDRTGGRAEYDFTLEWSLLRADGSTTSSAPDIFSSFSGQLDLKLVPQNVLVEMLVIDLAEMPTEN